MIKIRLIRMAQDSLKYVLLAVLWQWLGLLAQIVFAVYVSKSIAEIYQKALTKNDIILYFAIMAVCIILRLIFDRLYVMASFKASIDIKRIMRNKIYNKLLTLGSSYRSYISSAAITQMMGEGVEQLEVYFGKYLSQFVYAIIAPITLFIFLSGKNHKVAMGLLITVPLIPAVIMIVMIVAKRVLDKYFKIYYQLGDTFLEKLTGMTTLKIYQADGYAAEEMENESEQFRKVTMKVLSMQLNSTLVMDVIAYGGTAIGFILTISQLTAGRMELVDAIMFLILSAEFFLPMRLLGSYFHIGMNGMKAADKMFEFLDLGEPKQGVGTLEKGPMSITFTNVNFSYDNDEPMVSELYFNVPAGNILSIVGMSGSGKSTIAKLIGMQVKGYKGSIKINGNELSLISEESLLEAVTTVSLDSYIFPGTVRDNLLLGNKKLDDKKLISALTIVNLWAELKDVGGLGLVINEGGSNLSGGQRQRLAFARAILKNSPIYIFDEATSNIDMESEAIMMSVIKKLAKDKGKTVILISHRLANVVDSNDIILLADGKIIEHGQHHELLNKNHGYAKLFRAQMTLENYKGGE